MGGIHLLNQTKTHCIYIINGGSDTNKGAFSFYNENARTTLAIVGPAKSPVEMDLISPFSPDPDALSLLMNC